MRILNLLDTLGIVTNKLLRSNPMSEEKTAEIKDKATDLAKNIWLAGLGAYGRAIDEAQGTYQKVSEKVKVAQESTKLFDDLVEKGKTLEGSTQEKILEVKEKANVNLEERIAKVKDSLSFNFKKPKASDELLEEISQKLDLVLAAVEKPAAKAPAKRAAAKKTTAKEA